MPTVDLTIKNGRVVTCGSVSVGGLAIDDGKIVAVATDSNLPRGDRTIDAKGNYVLPGVIDPHTHPDLRPLYQTAKTEPLSSAAGGVTTFNGIVKSPNMSPVRKDFFAPEDVVSYTKVFEYAKATFEKHSLVDFTFTYAIQTDEHAYEIPQYAALHGVTSFKFYLGYKKADKWTSMVGLPTSFDDGTIYLGFENIGKIGPPSIAFIHAENLELTRIFRKRLIEAGRKDLSAWNERSPPFLEADHIRRYAFYAQRTGCPLYVVHVTSKEGLQEIQRARSDGVKVTAEAVSHYLAVSKDDNPPGLLGKGLPPLRGKEDIEALWGGLKNGTIDCVGSDDVPFKKEWKMHPKGIWATGPGYEGLEETFPTIEPGNVWTFGTGIAGTETMLPVVLSEGVNKRKMPIERVVELCCSNPAKALGLYPRKGIISIGSDGDITIVDVHKSVKVTADKLHSYSDFTVLEGRTLKGWPIMTIVRGNTVFEDGQIVGKEGMGKYLPRRLLKSTAAATV